MSHEYAPFTFKGRQLKLGELMRINPWGTSGWFLARYAGRDAMGNAIFEERGHEDSGFTGKVPFVRYHCVFHCFMKDSK